MRKRVSRKLWDKARNPPSSSSTTGTIISSKAIAILTAIIYELQPIDLMHHHADLRANILDLVTNTNGLAKTTAKTITIIPPIIDFLKRRSMKEWMALFLFIGYWKIVVYFHQTLDAGPFILILTALALIFTIGLGDRQSHGAGQGGQGGQGGQENLSAYSVFNRGFRNIMGGVDATALLQQHVGAGLMPPPGGGRDRDRDRHDHDDDDDDDDDGFRLRQQRQQERDRQRMLQQQRDRERLLQQQQQQQQEQQQDEVNVNININDSQLLKARKSNKKNRRKQNIELRREMQRQRDAAAAMGFAGDGQGQGQEGQEQGHVQIDMQHRDQIAMNRLVEDQILHDDGFQE